MEVKVYFADFDLEAEVEEAVIDKIREITGKEVGSLLKDSGIDYVTLNECINKAIETEVSRSINGKSETINTLIEKRIEKIVDKEIEGIIRLKVAKIMSPYINILKETKREKT